MNKIRKTVLHKLYDVDDYSIDSLIEKLEKAEQAFKKIEKGVENIRFTYKSVEDYGSAYTEFYLEGNRLETDLEFNKRIQEEDKAKEYRKQDYERLKKEFENE